MEGAIAIKGIENETATHTHGIRRVDSCRRREQKLDASGRPRDENRRHENWLRQFFENFTFLRKILYFLIFAEMAETERILREIKRKEEVMLAAV